MKKTLLILTIFSTLCHADFFKDIVAPQELTKQEICYQYLPKISTTNPDLSCIKTKDKNSGSLTEPFLAILESIFLPTLFVEMQYDESTTKRAAQIFPFVYAQACDTGINYKWQKLHLKIPKMFRYSMYQPQSRILLPNHQKKKHYIIFMKILHLLKNTLKIRPKIQ